MWELLKGLRDWILSLADKFTEAGLSALTENDIVLGVIDLSRYENKTLLSILPDSSEDTEEYDFVDGQAIKQSVTLTFLLRNRKPEKLIEDMSKYEEIICDELREHPSISGLCNGSGIGERKYFLDAGAVEEQMTAVEIPLTLLYEHNY